MCACGCGYVGCMCVCGPAAGAARLIIEYGVRMRALARGDLVCCSCNYVAENIVRVGLRGTTYTGALRRPAPEAGTHHPRASPVAAAGPAPEAGCRSSRRRGNLKPYTRNLSPCRTAICASAPMPCQCHVARTCRPLKLTLDLCLQRRPYHVPRLAGPCLAHTALGVATSYAAFLRARLHLLLLCLPCLSVLWRAPVPLRLL